MTCPRTFSIMILHQELILLIGTSLLAREIFASTSCFSKHQISMYYFCNLTEIPLVPSDTVKFLLSFNNIKQVNANSFPLLEQLLLLEIGLQFTHSVTIGKAAFENLPNLQVLDLGANRHLYLDPDAFVSLSNLTVLRLFGNALGDYILQDNYFQDLISLEDLDLSSNRITSLRPHPLFYNLKSLKRVNLKYNWIQILCEGNLDSFQGKTSLIFSLNSNHLYYSSSVDWAKCGNPLRNINLDTLDVGSNGWHVDIVQNFSTAVEGTSITFLKLDHHIMGAGFGFVNIKDPDNSTFAGLARSGLRLLDISQGFIFSLNPGVFQKLTDLEWLNLYNNKINQIQKGAFFGLGKLNFLNLSYNLLGELYDFTFGGLHNVAIIDLQKNHIGAIRENSFKDLLRLKMVNLRDNAIKIIPSLPTLTTAYLGENKLVSVRYRTIAAMYLDLEKNRLENLGDLYILSQIPDIQYIFLKQNRFSYCVKPDNVMANSQLIYLDLGENMIKLVWDRNLCLDVFWELSKLQVLHLNNNYLTTLPQDIFRGLASLNRLNLASNLLFYLSPGVFPESLKNLNISGNQLLSPDPGVFMTLSILDITHNRYFCDCTLSNLLLWLNTTNTTLAGSQDDIYCVHPPAFAGVPLSLLLFDGCNEDEILKPLQFAVFIFTSVVLVMFITAVIVFIHLRGTCFVWYKKIKRILVDDLRQAPDASAYIYDAYLCYSRKDFEWVQNSLLKHLDSQYSDKNRFTLCFEERDFLPGEDHISNIRDAIWNSRKTICIVTRQFLKDGWCVEALNFAQSRYFCDLKDVLIVVVVGSLSQYQLMKYKPVRVFMQRSRYMRWPEDHQDIGWFLNNLSHQILTEKKVKKKSNVMELQSIATIS
ncbi:toll-like receptor 5 isoform X1 [Alligator sinensis]|uniref:Toll-like receptor 5 n=2 Tax=Alligator sinensis TaxID=38654 RepID=A0A3Q0H303_ALLSI|nr:toll-like receptor 5 isoform X1 [Alligator sinensis]XP_025066424.1 toll-like receptor 5 isoform X1 [Alligator sinensis]